VNALPIRDVMRSAAVGTLALVSVVAALAAPQAHASALCNSSATVDLNIGAAAGVPAMKGDSLSTFGADRAKQQAAMLTAGGGSICQSKPSAATGRALAKVDALLKSGKRAQADALLKQTLAQLENDAKKEKGRRAFVERAPRVEAAGGCPDQSAHVSMKIKGVSDNLAVAQKALEAKDNQLAEQAMGNARAALKAWVQSPDNGVSTVGDWLRVLKGAEQLDAGQVITYANGRVRGQANADVAKAAQFDKCTVKKGDFDCWVKTIATAQLVGSFQEEQLKTAQDFGKAIEDRLKHVAPNGCEEWTFTMTGTTVMKNSGDVWTVKWGPGKFRVNREAGLLDGSYQAGYVPDGGWPGIIGSATDSCIETTDAGQINRGPATITGGAFHYKIDGTVDDSQIQVTASSDDANVTVTAPPDLGCQVLAGLAQLFLTGFVRSGIPVVFDVTRTQEQATFGYSDETGSLEAQIKRSPLVQP